MRTPAPPPSGPSDRSSAASAGAAAHPPWLHIVESTPSTQDLAAQLLAEGHSAPLAVLAAEQTRGRGRLGRRFESPPGGSLALTVAYRTELAPARRGWFPHAVGVAAVSALREMERPGAAPAGGRPDEGALEGLGLKWPNDLHVRGGRKLGGILAEARGSDVVLLGIGINLRGPVRDESGVEVPGAAWLTERAETDLSQRTLEELREHLATTLATAVMEELDALEDSAGDACASGLHSRYTMTCLTLGRSVRIDPAAGRRGGQVLRGTASGIDPDGRLVIDEVAGGRTAVAVGDVHHLRGRSDPDRPDPDERHAE